MFFSPAKITTHNCLLNLIVSARGSGKSFGTLLFCLKQYEQHGREFVYVRRTEKELAKSRLSLFSALEAAEKIMPGKYRAHGDRILVYNEDGEKIGVAGYLICLNLAPQYKSTSYPNVTNIIFEEFIEERNRYLTDEFDRFISIVETVFRMRDTGKERVFLLGNLYTVYNPYFNFLKVWPTAPGDIKFNESKTALAYHFTSSDFTDEKRKTRFAKMISGTYLGDYIVDNQSVVDDDDLVEDVKLKHLFFAVVSENEKFWVYGNGSDAIHISDKPNKADCQVFNLQEEFIKDAYNVNQTCPALRVLRRNINRGTITFNTVKVKQLVQRIYAKQR